MDQSRLGHWAALVSMLALAACAGTAAGDAADRAPVPQSRPAPVPEPAQATEASVRLGFADWRARFRNRAIAQGIEASLFDRAFAGVSPNPTVIERDRFQPEFTRPIWAYLDGAVSEARIAEGRRRAAAQAGVLAGLKQRYGVERGIVAAIWGIESAYGEIRGDIPVIEALATLAQDGRRQSFGEEQLLAALRILAAGDVSSAAMVGSWAGAMGHTQFIPTSYLAYAVDATGDGKRNIWGEDPTDALGSTANYLASFGWQLGAPTVRRVRLPAGFDYTLADQAIRRPVADWQAMGVAGEGTLPPGEAAVLLPAGEEGPAWLAYPNFRVIKRYNNATSYALAVSLLAEEIAGEAGVSRNLPWPRGDRALSRAEQTAFQQRLTALGYDTGGVDGIFGPKTRAAVRAYQRAEGLTPDGYVNDALLRRVGALGG
ncbi:MAG: lytic murein transglycosylase [Pseudomonadota bacterium]